VTRLERMLSDYPDFRESVLDALAVWSYEWDTEIPGSDAEAIAWLFEEVEES